MTKEKDFVEYKFHALRVYTSTEWLADSKKKYRQVFEKDQTGYVYAEFSFYNKLFDEKAWDVKVILKCYRLDDAFNKSETLCTIDVDRNIPPHENIVYFREGWGNPTPGKFWKKGKYSWEAFIGGKLIATRNFYVEESGLVTEEENPYLSVSGIKLFSGSSALVSKEKRKYYTTFPAKETQYIWGELNFQNQLKDQDWYCEVVFNFYNDARQLKGQTTELLLIRKGWDRVEVCSGWGSNNKGTWFKDNYTVEIVFQENLLLVVPFKVDENAVEGEPVPFLPGSGTPLKSVEPKPERTLDELMADFNALIGLETIKKKVTDYTQYLNFVKLRKEKGFEESDRISLHAVFTGNPGTGKTTVAKMLGKIYHKMGLLDKGHVHEVDRAELVGEFIGQTAPKVKEAIKKARGGVLFIDEAYALARSGSDQKDFGREVIEILIKEMSDGTGDFAVIVAGYPDEMNTFLDSNPGLKSRFNMYYSFPDYLPSELMAIGEFAANKRSVRLTDEARKYLNEKVIAAYRNRDRSFGNARYINGLIDEAKMNLGLRVMRSANPEELTEIELSTVEVEDVQEIFGDKVLRRANIPVDEALLQEAMARLNGLIGLDEVKNEVHEIVKLVKFYREIGKDVMNAFSLHMVFTGNPGTGKTTVARILADLFKALGILEKGHIVEVDRQGLVGGYLGQTAIKTAAKVDEAIGGVLFIDEAYALTQGGEKDYGKEAVETILKRMEDMRGQFIVIAAGYPDNMRRFLESNPGLRSRFDKKLQFEDYTPEELLEIADMMFGNEGIKADAQAKKQLKAYFSYIYENKDKYFGNARSVRKVVEEAIKNQHLRLSQMDASQRTPEMLNLITFEDVEEFHSDKEALINHNPSKIGFTIGTGKEISEEPEPPHETHGEDIPHPH